MVVYQRAHLECAMDLPISLKENVPVRQSSVPSASLKRGHNEIDYLNLEVANENLFLKGVATWRIPSQLRRSFVDSGRGFAVVTGDLHSWRPGKPTADPIQAPYHLPWSLLHNGDCISPPGKQEPKPTTTLKDASYGCGLHGCSISYGVQSRAGNHQKSQVEAQKPDDFESLGSTQGSIGDENSCASVILMADDFRKGLAEAEKCEDFSTQAIIVSQLDLRSGHLQSTCGLERKKSENIENLVTIRSGINTPVDVIDVTTQAFQCTQHDKRRHDLKDSCPGCAESKVTDVIQQQTKGFCEYKKNKNEANSGRKFNPDAVSEIDTFSEDSSVTLCRVRALGEDHRAQFSKPNKDLRERDANLAIWRSELNGSLKEMNELNGDHNKAINKSENCEVSPTIGFDDFEMYEQEQSIANNKESSAQRFDAGDSIVSPVRTGLKSQELDVNVKPNACREQDFYLRSPTCGSVLPKEQSSAESVEHVSGTCPVCLDLGLIQPKHESLQASSINRRGSSVDGKPCLLHLQMLDHEFHREIHRFFPLRYIHKSPPLHISRDIPGISGIGCSSHSIQLIRSLGEHITVLPDHMKPISGVNAQEFQNNVVRPSDRSHAAQIDTDNIGGVHARSDDYSVIDLKSLSANQEKWIVEIYLSDSVRKILPRTVRTCVTEVDDENQVTESCESFEESDELFVHNQAAGDHKDLHLCKRIPNPIASGASKNKHVTLVCLQSGENASKTTDGIADNRYWNLQDCVADPSWMERSVLKPLGNVKDLPPLDMNDHQVEDVRKLNRMTRMFAMLSHQKGSLLARKSALLCSGDSADVDRNPENARLLPETNASHHGECARVSQEKRLKTFHDMRLHQESFHKTPYGLRGSKNLKRIKNGRRDISNCAGAQNDCEIPKSLTIPPFLGNGRDWSSASEDSVDPSCLHTPRQIHLCRKETAKQDVGMSEHEKVQGSTIKRNIKRNLQKGCMPVGSLQTRAKTTDPFKDTSCDEMSVPNRNSNRIHGKIRMSIERVTSAQSKLGVAVDRNCNKHKSGVKRQYTYTRSSKELHRKIAERKKEERKCFLVQLKRLYAHDISMRGSLSKDLLNLTPGAAEESAKEKSSSDVTSMTMGDIILYRTMSQRFNEGNTLLSTLATMAGATLRQPSPQKSILKPPPQTRLDETTGDSSSLVGDTVDVSRSSRTKGKKSTKRAGKKAKKRRENMQVKRPNAAHEKIQADGQNMRKSKQKTKNIETTAKAKGKLPAAKTLEETSGVVQDNGDFRSMATAGVTQEISSKGQAQASKASESFSSLATDIYVPAGLDSEICVIDGEESKGAASLAVNGETKVGDVTGVIQEKTAVSSDARGQETKKGMHKGSKASDENAKAESHDGKESSGPEWRSAGLVSHTKAKSLIKRPVSCDPHSKAQASSVCPYFDRKTEATSVCEYFDFERPKQRFTFGDTCCTQFPYQSLLSSPCTARGRGVPAIDNSCDQANRRAASKLEGSRVCRNWIREREVKTSLSDRCVYTTLRCGPFPNDCGQSGTGRRCKSLIDQHDQKQKMYRYTESKKFRGKKTELGDIGDHIARYCQTHEGEPKYFDAHKKFSKLEKESIEKHLKRFQKAGLLSTPHEAYFCRRTFSSGFPRYKVTMPFRCAYETMRKKEECECHSSATLTSDQQVVKDKEMKVEEKQNESIGTRCEKKEDGGNDFSQSLPAVEQTNAVVNTKAGRLAGDVEVTSTALKTKRGETSNKRYDGWGAGRGCYRENAWWSAVPTDTLYKCDLKFRPDWKMDKTSFSPGKEVEKGFVSRRKMEREATCLSEREHFWLPFSCVNAQRDHKPETPYKQPTFKPKAAATGKSKGKEKPASSICGSWFLTKPALDCVSQSSESKSLSSPPHYGSRYDYCKLSPRSGRQHQTDTDSSVSAERRKRRFKTSAMSDKEQKRRIKTSAMSDREQERRIKTSAMSDKEQERRIKTSAMSDKEQERRIKTSAMGDKEQERRIKTSAMSDKEQKKQVSFNFTHPFLWYTPCHDLLHQDLLSEYSSGSRSKAGKDAPDAKSVEAKIQKTPRVASATPRSKVTSALRFHKNKQVIRKPNLISGKQAMASPKHRRSPCVKCARLPAPKTKSGPSPSGKSATAKSSAKSKDSGSECECVCPEAYRQSDDCFPTQCEANTWDICGDFSRDACLSSFHFERKSLGLGRTQYDDLNLRIAYPRSTFWRRPLRVDYNSSNRFPRRHHQNSVLHTKSSDSFSLSLSTAERYLKAGYPTYQHKAPRFSTVQRPTYMDNFLLRSYNTDFHRPWFKAN
ncbi:serine/arginine repetitive matrix protein 2-like [Plakobranchus ocellatus]|uniref:Serine/arginine repetitive matrix protein 2-like n=1 Tax=Plakobranchus ocellatus TaxID=259542 RepID=A0AAV3ZAA3_9GAST|nr:serine/arginine repetitive matrix protein 2-like [Plakobranchus ocellatus]